MNTQYQIDKTPKRSDEPIWWGLFGAGGTWFAMITPVTILVLGILAPLGIIDAEALSYARVSGFATSLIGGLFVIGTLALPMWHAMHRVHHGMHDLKIHTGVAGKIACYAFAGLISALAVIFALMI
ncbi:Fumarate reductase subunit D [Vibrio nigripulchritudo SFn27]|uniref:Fumarate reductase subunit D n=1 Tax=Vibrio nigripulchritudo TaxID=28173 RepID=U4K9E0_9VIBR|nr:fumarate reductase subunit FrdD [Vibrio nigripulchritudo]CCN85350.1 Fumarate reductase subunit D [Vibrio nigripulchritudo BLFn1]CCN87906.1 Fumarate reductase subunit D [Vibrio nigripulchritudo SFn27]CCN94491.1 Fumarate reductase subunit D [Vibrio nigripulchritudo ENn2]CCO41416.1 Fumarate reductase subunit D [Vibrio nigripulchritudo SFn135]CCO54409.1 Fumarate reductase subunit D [Vibrio nigripulchritudo Wn13]